jgi:hypothetical protein
MEGSAMKVRLRENWGVYPPGEVVSLSSERAAYLVKEEIAVYLEGQGPKPKPEPEPEPAPEANDKAETGRGRGRRKTK